MSKKLRKKKAKRKALKNGISKTDIQAGQKSLVDGFASRYEEVKREIDQLVLEIRTNVSRSNPELLMDYLAAMNFKKPWKLNGFRVFSCPEIFDGFSWRSMVFDRFFIVNEGLTAVFRAFLVNKWAK